MNSNPVLSRLIVFFVNGSSALEACANTPKIIRRDRKRSETGPAKAIIQGWDRIA